MHKSFQIYKSLHMPEHEQKSLYNIRLCVNASPPRLLPEITIYGAYNA